MSLDQPALTARLGIAASNLALIVPNAVAAVVIVVTITVALRYRQLPPPD